MRYHDFHLEGYTVSDYGRTITLKLTWNYPGQDRAVSLIQFSDVALYQFSHTDGAIITDIVEIPMASLISRHQNRIEDWARRLSVRYWDEDLDGYRKRLEELGLKAWQLTSAIGFEGFVIAKSVKGGEESDCLESESHA